MKVYMERQIMVKPSGPTWNGPLSISELDQVAGNYHVPLIYVYEATQNCLSKASGDIFEAVRNSLSKVLVGFYPLAGRLSYIGGGRHRIECNGKGVPFIEAKAEATLDELKESEYCQLVPSMDLITNRTSPKLPLAAVQFTSFNCGGFCLGVTICHLAADGRSATNFFAEWAAIARGEICHPAQPLVSRKQLCTQGVEALRKPPRPVEFDKPPALIGESAHKNAMKITVGAYLTLSKSQVELLKKSVNTSRVGHKSPSFSRFESIAAHIWRCTCKARNHRPDQQTRLTTSVDIRQHMQPPLPKTYLGNAVLDVEAADCAGDLILKPLSYAASRIREAINKATAEYVEETICFLRGADDLSSVNNSNSICSGDDDQKEGFHGNPNLSVTSWLSLPFQGLDFGWGKEIYMRPLAKTWDGDTVVLPGSDDSKGSVVVAICLQESHMEAFRTFFYDDLNGI